MILCTLIILLKITGKILLVSNTANTRKLIQEETRTTASNTVITAEIKNIFDYRSKQKLCLQDNHV